MRQFALLLLIAACHNAAHTPAQRGPTLGPNSSAAAKGPRLSIQGQDCAFQSARVESVDNDNARFLLSIAAPGARLEPSLESVYLVVGGERLSMTGATSDPGRKQTTYVRSADRAQAMRLASELGVELEERSSPGHRLRAHFEVPASSVQGAGSVPIRFVLENSGTVPITFLESGNSRDWAYSFHVERDGLPLEPRPGLDLGGLAVERRLLPGAIHTRALDLAEWYAFDLPGNYTGECAYAMELWSSAAPSSSPAQRWDEVLRASFVLRVDPQR